VLLLLNCLPHASLPVLCLRSQVGGISMIGGLSQDSIAMVNGFLPAIRLQRRLGSLDQVHNPLESRLFFSCWRAALRTAVTPSCVACSAEPSSPACR